MAEIQPVFAVWGFCGHPQAPPPEGAALWTPVHRSRWPDRYRAHSASAKWKVMCCLMPGQRNTPRSG